ncbi:MAG: TonB-dependent receptor, partial [Gemmataceae bacterium]|nr:TonB-dependent receptor [Gemmataceae bacterium]
MDTRQKAIQINMDSSKYGAFTEIGAGQEVARWFFSVGGASGTIAKTMSAYDMTVSDAIYGPCERYVSKQRLQSMLDREYDLLVERLDTKRGETTKFFAFANTVAANSFSRKEDAHGWLGLQFQMEPKGDVSQVIIHVRLLDPENIQEQEALGILGVNLIHAAIYHHTNADEIIDSLLDGLSAQRAEVD